MNSEIAIFCAGSLGKELLDFLKMDKYFDIIFIDDVTNENYYNGAKIIRYEEFKRKEKKREIIIATGEPIYRKKIREMLEKDGCILGKYISSKAIIGSNVDIGAGVIIMPNTYIANGTTIGVNSIVHYGAIVEEGVYIKNDSFVSLGAFVGAKTEIGKQCFIGPNSTIRNNIKIEDCCTIGMGSCVTKSTEKGVYVGNPAVKISEEHDLVFKK